MLQHQNRFVSILFLPRTSFVTVLPGGAYLPVPHSWHTLCANAGLRASMQQKIRFSRSVSQHGLIEVGERVAVGEEVGVAVGAMLGQALPRLVPSTPL